MTFIRGLWVGASIAAMAMAATPGQAAVITQTISFTATDFTLLFGDGSTPPIDPAKLSFTVTLDNSADVSNATTGLTILSTNLPFTFEYAYSSAADILTIATEATPFFCSYGAAGACAFISGFSTAPTPIGFLEYVGGDDLYSARTISPGVAAVPEPLTWAMMIAGFGAVGCVSRRRQKITTTVRFA